MDRAAVLGAVRKLLHESEMGAPFIEPSLEALNVFTNAKCRLNVSAASATLPRPIHGGGRETGCSSVPHLDQLVSLEAGVICPNLFKETASRRDPEHLHTRQSLAGEGALERRIATSP
jgi:hypothetical protein